MCAEQTSYGLISRDMALVASYWADRDALRIDDAKNTFIELVDPEICRGGRPSFRKIAMVNMCFTEWVLFEYRISGGLTPLSAILECPSSALSDTSVRRLRQVAETQFFSRFAIIDKDSAAGFLMAEDLSSGEHYTICDPVASANSLWRDGSLAMRIALVDGVWHTVGQTRLYDRTSPRLGERASRDNDTLARDRSCFVRLLRDTLGQDGRYHASTRIVEAEACY